MISDWVLPDIEDSDTAPFWVAASERRLVVQKCDSCRELRFPPQPFCGRCRHATASWVPVSGRGRIWSYVIVHAPILPAYEPFLPYPVVVIELEEDKRLRMVGNLVADQRSPINSVDSSSLRIGLPVQVVFQVIARDIVLPRWRLIEAG